MTNIKTEEVYSQTESELWGQCVFSPYKNVKWKNASYCKKKMRLLRVLITPSDCPCVMSRCNNTSWGITNYTQSVACICTHSHHTCWPCTSNPIPPVPMKMARTAATIHLCPEIASFLSAQIAALRETDISVVTGKQHILTATFQCSTQSPFQMELEWSKRPSLSPMSWWISVHL